METIIRQLGVRRCDFATRPKWIVRMFGVLSRIARTQPALFSLRRCPR